MYDVNAPLAVPLPVPFLPAFIGRWVSWMVAYIDGVVVGEWLLGYKPSYDDYYKKEAK